MFTSKQLEDSFNTSFDITSRGEGVNLVFKNIKMYKQNCFHYLARDFACYLLTCYNSKTL